MDKKKKIIIGAALAAVIVIGIIVAILFLGGGSEEGYRVIKLYQIDGTVMLYRESIGEEMEAFENMSLQTGDRVTVMDKSFARLQMDDDKYALAEANSVFTVEASGTAEKGTTNINLESGAVTIEIQNKLGSESSYQVTTPNSVMAVRGTVFRIALTMDEETGKPVAKLDVFEGSVAIQRVTVNEAGEKVVEEVEYTAEKGGQVIIQYSEDSEENVIVINDVPVYDDLPLETLYFLQEITEEKEIAVPVEELVIMIEEKVAEIQASLEAEMTSLEESAESFEEVIESVEESSTEEIAETEESIVVMEPETVEELEETEETVEETVEEKKPVVNLPTEYTVTFYYGDVVFATQVVQRGSTATKPKLQPAETGSWDYDFTTPVTSDLAINWK